MPFDAYARRQAQVLFDAFADSLVKDLSKAAREEAQASAAQARKEAEQAAGTALAAARAEGDARLAAAQAMYAGLIENVEAAQEEVRATQAAAQAEIARVRAELDARLAEGEPAFRAVRRDTSRAEEALEIARLDASRAEEAREIARRASIAARIEADACRQDQALIVERVGAALSAIDRATSPREILETLLEPLEREFARTAVFLVGPSSLNGWQARGLDSSTDIAKLVILRSKDSPLTRAVTERKRLFLTATPGEPIAEVLGAPGTSSPPVTRAIVLPVLAGEQVVAVAYAEDVAATTDRPEATTPGVGCKIAEMLIDHAMLRLTTKRAPAARPAAPPDQPTGYSPARQARRLKLERGIDITLDGAEGALVDLSSIGAQILSPLAMSPNRMVKMTLRTKDQALGCKGRVIWARFEQPRGTIAARYRVGVKFTDIETKTLETLMAEHGNLAIG